MFVCIELFNFKIKCELRSKLANLRKCMGAIIIFSAIFVFFFSYRPYLSHNHTKYVKQQVISFSTTLVYHSHIEKCDLGVEKLNKLNSWRPFWKISCNLFSSPN